MFVLGIDPGLTRCGYGLVAKGGGTASFDRDGRGHPRDGPRRRPSSAGSSSCRAGCARCSSSTAPTSSSSSALFFQTNARTATGVAQASGVALACAVEHGCAVAQYTSNEVKLAVVGYGAATKLQVQTMVARQVGLAGPPPSPDAADALALAVCHLVGASLRDRRAAPRRRADDRRAPRPAVRAPRRTAR